MRLRLCLLLMVLLSTGALFVESASAQGATNTPAPGPTETPWYTPTPVPVGTVALQLPGIVPTFVESYADTAEYAVQWWHTFTSPVSGVDRLLTMFLIGVVLFGMARIFTLIRGRWGQLPPASGPSPTSTALALPDDEKRSGGYTVRPRVTVEREYRIVNPPRLPRGD